MLLCTTGYLTYCDHLIEAILLLTTTCYTLPIAKLYNTKYTFNSMETIHWCLITLTVLANYLISNVHDD